MTTVLRSVAASQKSFKGEVAKTRKELTDTYNKRYEARVSTSAAAKAMQNLNKKLEPMQKKIVKAVAIKDNATAKIKGISDKLKAVGSKVAAPLVKVKDTASKGIANISSKLKSLTKSVVIPVAVAGGAVIAGVASAAKAGMQLEQQKISMEHFIGATNTSMDDATVKKVSAEFTEALRKNANATPFETGDVIAAGSRAIAIAGGNTKDAMSMVKLAEDMAAASGGTKTISDAIEALADAKMGETERLKEFGFKVSAKEFESKGFAGVQKDLGNFYGGAAEKLATSGAGLLSTITGKLKSSWADFGLGVVDKMKPAFDSIIGLVDKASPYMEKFGGQIADGIGKGIEFVSNLLPYMVESFRMLKPVITTVLQGFAPLLPIFGQIGTAIQGTRQQVITAFLPVLQTIIQTVQTVLPAVLPILTTVITTISSVMTVAAPIIQGLVVGIGTAVSTLAPVFNTIFGGIGEKVGSVINFIGEKMSFITEVINWAAPMISDILNTAWTVISPIMDIAIGVFKTIFSVCQAVFPGVQKIIETVWNVLKPIVEVIGTVLGGIGKALNWLGGLLGISSNSSASTPEIGNNANGTNNWRGGPTWVGEKGPELLDLPRGSKILPNKESVALTSGMSSSYGSPPKSPATMAKGVAHSISVTIAKLADSIIVREEADIDRIGEKFAKEIKDAVRDLVPA